MKKIFLFFAVTVCFCISNKIRANEKENIIQSMQNYIIENDNLPNLDDIIRDLKKLHENCPSSQRELINEAITRINPLLQMFQNRFFEGEGTVQDLRKYVEKIHNNLGQLRDFSNAYNNQRYRDYVNYDWEKLLDILNRLLKDENLVVELDDKLVINNEKELADYMMKTVETLNVPAGEESMQKKKVVDLSQKILGGNLSYADLAKTIVQLTSNYNRLAEENNWALIRISHIRDIRDSLVERFLEAAIAVSKEKNLGLVGREMQKLKWEYNKYKSRPDVLNIIKNVEKTLGEAGLDSLALRAISLRDAISIINAAIVKNEKAYYRSVE